MEAVFTVIFIQGMVGALDNIWHHQLTERLQTQPRARKELTLHTVREFLYGIIFLGLAWLAWAGAWAVLLLVLMAIEIGITLWDFVEEDRSRKLPPFERVLHTVLAINFGVLLALLTPIWVAWVAADTELRVVNYGAYSWIMSLFGFGVLGWAFYDAWVVSRLGVPDWIRSPIKHGHSDNPKHILVTGGTGFVGRALVRALIERGDRPLLYARSTDKAKYLFGAHVDVVTDLGQIAPDRAIDGVVNLAGEPILGWPWTTKRKSQLLESRVGTTKELIEFFRCLRQRPDVLVSGSAIGYYGRHGDEILTEADGPQSIFMSELCQRWEEAALVAASMGIRICRLRIGLVFGSDGGALPRFMRAVRFGLGAVLGPGRQWVSWIHIGDLVRLILFAIDRPVMNDAVNATSPEPVTNEQLMRALGRHLKRPVLLYAPELALRSMLGEMADLFASGQRALPSVAVEKGFQFAYPDIDAALRDVMADKDASCAERTIKTVHFNDDCPICSTEIRHYSRILDKAGIPLTLRPVTRHPNDLAPYGLNEAERRRRIYVSEGDGTLVGGIDALVEIWLRTPNYRWIAFLIRQPLIHAVAEVAYESLVVPLLAHWNERRAKRNAEAQIEV